LLNALAGHDQEDVHSLDLPAEDFTRDLRHGLRGAAIGLPSGFYSEHVDQEVQARIRDAIEVFVSLGAQVREVEVPNLWETLHAQRLILASEAYAVHEESLENEPEKFGEEVRERLMDGGRPKAYRYANARRRGMLATGEFDRALHGVDVLLTPTLPIVATEIGQREVSIGDYEESVRSALTRFTGPTDLTGHPSLSVPCGTTASGLPVGLQLIGRRFEEAGLYRFGHAYEEVVVPEPDTF
jgi:aspartyl-tRNA(Asn)/glutamyl-tRNA(Gln) amidotransferase subunit A